MPEIFYDFREDVSDQLHHVCSLMSICVTRAPRN